MNSSSIVTQAFQLKILYYLVKIAEIYVQNIPKWTSNSLTGGKQRGGAFRARDFIALLVAIVLYVFVEIRIIVDVRKLRRILNFLSNAFEEIQKDPNKIFDMVQNNPQIRSIMQNVLQNKDNMQAYLLKTFDVKPAILTDISNGVMKYKLFENSLYVVIPLAIIISLLNQRYKFIPYNPGSSMLSNVQSTLGRLQELIEQSMDRLRGQVEQIPVAEPERHRCLGETCLISLDVFDESNINDAVIIDQQCYSRRSLLQMLTRNPDATVPHNRNEFSDEQLREIYGNDFPNVDNNVNVDAAFNPDEVGEILAPLNAAYEAALNRVQQLYNRRLPNYLSRIQQDFQRSHHNSPQASREEIRSGLDYYSDASRYEYYNRRYENELQNIRNGIERNENVYGFDGPVENAVSNLLLIAMHAENARLLENRLNQLPLEGGKRKTRRNKKHGRRTKRRFMKRS